MNPAVHAGRYRLLGLVVLGLGLYLWPWLADRLGCVAAALFITPYWAVATLGGMEHAILKRQAFIAQYLTPGGKLGRLLQPGLLVLSIQTGKALVLTLVLLIGYLSLPPALRLTLLLNLLFLPLLVKSVEKILVGEVKSEAFPRLVRYWCQWINALMLWPLLTLILMYSTQIDYTGMNWQAVAHHGAAQVETSCDVLAFLARIQAVSQALMLWAAQNLFAGLDNAGQIILAWTFFMAWFGVSFFIAWGYSRVLFGTLAQPGWKRYV
jgi:hypothetical protein